jgi:hypothetical protein
MKIAFVDDGVYAYASRASSAAGGSGANRTVTPAPAANQFGTAAIIITVSDDQLTTPTSFLATHRSDMNAPITP